jgi:alanyl-tRNA synthetase
VEIPGWDVEACGGVHCRSTGETMMIKILRTERIQDGVERIVFSSGMEAVKAVQGLEDLVSRVEGILETSRDRLVRAVAGMKEEALEVRGRMKEFRRIYIQYMAERLAKNLDVIGGVKAAIFITEDAPDEDLIAIGERLEEMVGDAVYIACNRKRGMNCIIFVGEKLRKRGLKASDMAKHMGRAFGGGGAGDARFAKAGGPRPGDVKEILERCLEEVGFR